MFDNAAKEKILAKRPSPGGCGGRLAKLGLGDQGTWIKGAHPARGVMSDSAQKSRVLQFHDRGAFGIGRLNRRQSTF